MSSLLPSELLFDQTTFPSSTRPFCSTSLLAVSSSPHSLSGAEFLSILLIQTSYLILVRSLLFLRQLLVLFWQFSGHQSLMKEAHLILSKDSHPFHLHHLLRWSWKPMHSCRLLTLCKRVRYSPWEYYPQLKRLSQVSMRNLGWFPSCSHEEVFHKYWSQLCSQLDCWQYSLRDRDHVLLCSSI